MIKTCTKCKEAKDSSCFSKRAVNKTDGLRATCKQCDKTNYEQNKPLYKELNAKNYQENKGRKLASSADWYSRNKERKAQTVAAWASANRHKNAEKTRKRRAIKIDAMPKWADLKAIQAIYEFAVVESMATGIKHEVDHIVPLVSNTVCGLHCEANLQVLKSFDNRSKGNRVWPDMP